MATVDKKLSVSVVIATYNSADLVVQAVASVLAQTVAAAEIIVVDDGSTDDTRARLGAYGRQVRYVYQKNQGVSAARNRGVIEAAGEYVAFLDADDVWHPRKLETQLGVLARRPELGMLGTDLFNWTGEGFPNVDELEAVQAVDVAWIRLAVRNYFVTSSVVLRSEDLRRAGEFDTSLDCAEDRDLWLRVAEIATVANVHLPLTGYRHVAGSLSKRAAKCQDGMHRVLAKMDQRGVWRGRWLVRRRSHGYMWASCSYLHGYEANYAASLVCMLKSFAWYPLPYSRAEMRGFFTRPRRLVAILLRALGLKRPEAVIGPERAGGSGPVLGRTCAEES